MSAGTTKRKWQIVSTIFTFRPQVLDFDSGIYYKPKQSFRQVIYISQSDDPFTWTPPRWLSREIYLLRIRIEFRIRLTNSNCGLWQRKLNSKTRIESIMLACLHSSRLKYFSFDFRCCVRELFFIIYLLICINN